MTRDLRPFAALAMVVLIGAGCSKSPTDAASSTSRTSSTTSTVLSASEQAVKFAECIREHDVPDFPDANAQGEFIFGINVSPEVWAKAVDACKDLQPPGSLSSERSPEEQSASLRFAQCVRDNGVPDFPDPVDGEPLIDTTKIPSSDRAGGMAILGAATKKCGDLLDKAARGQ
jgi:hypothetical protein